MRFLSEGSRSTITRDRRMQHFLWTVIFALLLSVSSVPPFSRWLAEFLNSHDFIRERNQPESPAAARQFALARKAATNNR